MQTYTRAQIVHGTGWPRGARFALIDPTQPAQVSAPLGPLAANNGDCWYLSDDAGETVAVLAGPDDRQAAYARLFAAAPDMAAALQVIDDAFTRGGDFQLGPKGRHVGFDVVVRALLARLDGPAAGQGPGQDTAETGTGACPSCGSLSPWRCGCVPTDGGAQ